ETTAIENHSGLVDNLRNFKTDLKLISSSLKSVRPVAKQRHLVIATGDSAVFDLYLLNDTNAPVMGRLTFSMRDPKGVTTELKAFDCPRFEKDRFAYVVHEAFTTKPLRREGAYSFRFELPSHPDSTFEREILVVDSHPKRSKTLTVGIWQLSADLRTQLERIPAVAVQPFSEERTFDIIATSARHIEAQGKKGEETGLEDARAQAGASAAVDLAFPPALLQQVRQGTSLLVVPETDPQTDALARAVAALGAFEYRGLVGILRAPWMGAWYFVRQHPVYDGLPVNCAMTTYYQVKGSQSNGLLVDGVNVEIIAAYSRDHDRNIGAGTFTSKIDRGTLLFHRVPPMHPVLQMRCVSNALAFLADCTRRTRVS
ncbi:MAG: glycoside hydrolase, partial [Acidobacteriaceae bacterium]|nr:glycoside hydrolase [Acidobacteriaceae bacterium]